MAERALQNILFAEARAFARMDLLNREVITKALTTESTEAHFAQNRERFYRMDR